MAYRYGQKLKTSSNKVKKMVAGVAASIAILAAAAVPALAAYGTQPGFDTSTSNTPCAGHGAFGAFGNKGDVAHDFRGGANGDATAANNSTLCGNPQGAAGQIGT